MGPGSENRLNCVAKPSIRFLVQTNSLKKQSLISHFSLDFLGCARYHHSNFRPNSLARITGDIVSRVPVKDDLALNHSFAHIRRTIDAARSRR
jgi:hypothetical protein